MDVNLNRYAFVSSVFCFTAFFIVRITDTAILSLFLKYNHINHVYNVIFVEYMNGGQNNWTEGKVIFIYTVPYFLFALGGIFIPHFLRRKDNIYLQLSITWISFHMVLLVLAGLAGGIFEFRGLGVAMEWFFINKVVKIVAALLLIAVIFTTIRRYAWYFMRKVPHRSLHDDFDHRKLWIKKSVLLPFLFAFALIFPFASLETWLNFVFSFVIGLVFIGNIYRALPLVYIPIP